MGEAGDRITLCELNNSVPHSFHGSRRRRSRDPEVLFLARLHPRERPGMFVQNGATADP
jgi:hypothetical protein